MTLPFTHVLGAACAADEVEPSPTRTVSDKPGALTASGGDSERPDVEILTSGAVSLENGHVVIHFHASDDRRARDRREPGAATVLQGEAVADAD